MTPAVIHGGRLHLCDSRFPQPTFRIHLHDTTSPFQFRYLARGLVWSRVTQTTTSLGIPSCTARVAANSQSRPNALLQDTSGGTRPCLVRVHTRDAVCNCHG